MSMRTNTISRASFGALGVLSVLALASCASSGASSTKAEAPAAPATHQEAHAATPTTAPAAATPASAPVASADPNAPLRGSAAVLVVNGMSCPKCANNIHVSLSQVPGVADSAIDLQTGRVTVTFDKLAKFHPSQAALAKVVKDSGFTLVSIETP